MNLDVFYDVYGKKLYENEQNILFWENYLQNLEALDFNIFVEKLTVPILVPIGNRILFRGELKHTNEVTVALGADYFTKCSVKQAEILKQHRIKDAKSKLDAFRKEKDYLQSQLSISKELNEESGCDVVEVATEEEDKKWREQHRENVRKYKQRKVDDDKEAPGNEMTDDELWDRLEELELQEELKKELQEDEMHESNPSTATAYNETDSDDENDDDIHDDTQNNVCDEMHQDMEDRQNGNNDDQNEEKDEVCNHNKKTMFQQPSKDQLFEQVVERHNDLKRMLAEIKTRHRPCQNENDLIDRVSEMEKLEELEDEIAILEDMLASDDDDIEEAEEEDNSEKQQKKSVAFADDDDCDTFELTFKHSEVEPFTESYVKQNGIQKPSDIYKAFPEYFNCETKSILKKPNCDASPVEPQTKPIKENKREDKEEANQDCNINSTIVVKDVVEKVNCNDKNSNQNERPISLFKKRRQQLKE